MGLGSRSRPIRGGSKKAIQRKFRQGPKTVNISSVTGRGGGRLQEQTSRKSRRSTSKGALPKNHSGKKRDKYNSDFARIERYLFPHCSGYYVPKPPYHQVSRRRFAPPPLPILANHQANQGQNLYKQQTTLGVSYVNKNQQHAISHNNGFGMFIGAKGIRRDHQEDPEHGVNQQVLDPSRPRINPQAGVRVQKVRNWRGKRLDRRRIRGQQYGTAKDQRHGPTVSSSFYPIRDPNDDIKNLEQIGQPPYGQPLNELIGSPQQLGATRVQRHHQTGFTFHPSGNPRDFTEANSHRNRNGSENFGSLEGRLWNRAAAYINFPNQGECYDHRQQLLHRKPKEDAEYQYDYIIHGNTMNGDYTPAGASLTERLAPSLGPSAPPPNAFHNGSVHDDKICPQNLFESIQRHDFHNYDAPGLDIDAGDGMDADLYDFGNLDIDGINGLDADLYDIENGDFDAVNGTNDDSFNDLFRDHKYNFGPNFDQPYATNEEAQSIDWYFADMGPDPNRDVSLKYIFVDSDRLFYNDNVSVLTLRSAVEHYLYQEDESIDFYFTDMGPDANREVTLKDIYLFFHDDAVSELSMTFPLEHDFQNYDYIDLRRKEIVVPSNQSIPYDDDVSILTTDSEQERRFQAYIFNIDEDAGTCGKAWDIGEQAMLSKEEAPFAAGYERKENAFAGHLVGQTGQNLTLKSAYNITKKAIGVDDRHRRDLNRIDEIF